jgi:hypothetical protein
MCIRSPAKRQMTFDLQTILVQDQTFHLSQEVTQLLALEYSYLRTDKIQTYKKIPVLGESGMF